MFSPSPAFKKKIEDLENLLSTLLPNEKMNYLIGLARLLPPFLEEWKTPENLVKGCQSVVYLHSDYKDGKIFFQASSDSLMVSGLASLLFSVYSGESPQYLIDFSPQFLLHSGLLSSLSPTRSNGLAHIHQRMRQDALYRE